MDHLSNKHPSLRLAMFAYKYVCRLKLLWSSFSERAPQVFSSNAQSLTVGCARIATMCTRVVVAAPHQVSSHGCWRWPFINLSCWTPLNCLITPAGTLHHTQCFAFCSAFRLLNTISILQIKFIGYLGVVCWLSSPNMAERGAYTVTLFIDMLCTYMFVLRLSNISIKFVIAK